MAERAKGKKRGRPLVAAVLAFLLAAVLCAALIVVAVANRTGLERATMEQVILEKSLQVGEVVSRLLYKTQALAALVVQGGGEVRDFERVAATLVDDPAILNVLLAPGGVVAQVYPTEAGDALLGFDFMEELAGNIEARRAVETGELVFGGPFLGTQGRMILSGRLPVWQQDETGERTLWGIVAVTLKYPEVLQGAGLDALEMQGLAFEIWRTNPDDGLRQVIARSDYPYSKNRGYIERELEILGAEWHFRISPVREWYQYPENWIMMGAALCIALLVAFVVRNNAELRWVRRVLQAQEQAAQATAAQAGEASRQKSVFLAVMSHEMRTPLSSIIGYAELAAQDAQGQAGLQSHLDKIQRGARGLLHIIDGVLDLSKVEAGKMELERIPFSVEEVLGVCEELCAMQLQDRPVALQCRVDPQVGMPLLGDPTRLWQVLTNLLGNAAKFTEAGSILLACGLVGEDTETVTLRFEVKDSGIGMTAEQARLVMQPFVQADGSTTRRYGGTGLGLAVARDLVALMGGELAVESAPGVGSRFSFTLRFDKAQDAPVPESGAAPARFTGRVLLCEDTPMNQEVAMEQLRRAGVCPTLAAGGAEAVALVDEGQRTGRPFGLILMDIHMPGMDGLEAVAAIRALGCTTPVAAMTANVMAQDIAAYRQAGLDDVLPKPFTARDLRTLLARWLPAAGDCPALDEAAGLAAADGDAAYRLQLLERFVRQNRDAWEGIAGAVAAQDLKTAHRLAHAVKGTARLVGALPLAAAAGAAEAGLAEGRADAAQMDALGQALNAALNAARQVLEQGHADG